MDSRYIFYINFPKDLRKSLYFDKCNEDQWVLMEPLIESLYSIFWKFFDDHVDAKNETV